ncbi:patatin-like phospholipase family protein [Rariglobus hedericola]|uniref:Patatin n=1 Tax=Rariglobus hedericola TaxID=2597822 RepID=A0A556QEK1_9BACT|nr:patatin-like phospholipase family protein [Rariglobus hedericola]TSJ75047.1 patatin [Rariglobus hedericola]
MADVLAHSPLHNSSGTGQTPGVNPDPVKLALVLAGGGARAAYQVGFLRSLAKSFPELEFPIMTGVSAGAINVAHLANNCGTLPVAVEELTDLWESITIDQVFRTDLPALVFTMLRWAMRLVSGGVNLSTPAHGLVDTDPLRAVLEKALAPGGGPLSGIGNKLRSGHLSAVGITTTNYTTGQSNSWVQGEHLNMWERPGRRSFSTELTVDHIMASCALPLFFPAGKIGHDWHGDGGVRLTAPLSPALHLGARRMIAISTQYAGDPSARISNEPRAYPPPATIIGLLLDSIFLDMLDYDALSIERVNSLLASHPSAHETGLHPVDLLLIRPSMDLSVIANEFESELPRTFRFATRGLGTRETRRADMLATLMFQPGYIRRLIALGEADGDRRHDEIARFLAPVLT